MLVNFHIGRILSKGKKFLGTLFYHIRLFVLISFLFFISGCVEPPEYNDGLLENIPAIINEPDFFSFSLRAEDYTDSISYDLEFSSTNTNLLNTSLVVKDYSGQASDSTFIRLYNDNIATMLDILVNTNITAFSEDSVLFTGNPHRMEFVGSEFSGLVDFQILRQ